MDTGEGDKGKAFDGGAFGTTGSFPWILGVIPEQE